MDTALVLIDIQNDYFKGGKHPLFGSEKASKNAGVILNKFRELNKLIVHIQHIGVRSDSAFFLPNTYGAEIHKNVQPLQGEKVIEKHFPNSFRETELHYFLQTNSVTDLVICGMMSHMCVDATTRAAKDLGYNLVVISDACATRDLELNGAKIKAPDVHTSFMAALNNFYATITFTKEFTDTH